MTPLVIITLLSLAVSAYGFNKIQLGDALIEELVNRYGTPLRDSSFEAAVNQQHSNEDEISHLAKSSYGNRYQRMDDLLLDREPTIRDQEYLQHSTLWGHQFVEGGNSEVHQQMKPEGSQLVKSDAILPAYCNPPNPCPLGYSAEDGCLEDFVNSAAFSRDYQANEECMCDSEHMFDCPRTSDDAQLDAFARSFANQGYNENDVNQVVNNIDDGKHKIVAKKFHTTKKRPSPVYLSGERLPVVAKKSPLPATI